VAESFSIEGRAPSYSGKRIELLRYHDYVTQSFEVLATGTVNDDGTFSLSAPLNNVELLRLRIDYTNAQFFGTPGTIYNVEVPDLPSDQARTVAKTNMVELIFNALPPADLNSLISEFNLRYENFFAKHYYDLADGQFIAALDSFRTDTEHAFEARSEDVFFDHYRKYAYGSIELLSKDAMALNISRKTLYEKYLKEQPVYYANPEYMAFIDGYFSNYFSQYMFTKGDKIIKYAINEKMSYTILREAMNHDDFLKDPRLQELILIKGLGDLFHHKEFDQANIIGLLDSATMLTVYPENSLIAEALKNELTAMSVGYPAPEFQLLTLSGDSVSLSDLRGKYVYINFWASWNKASVLDMRLLPPMVEKYKEDVVFVSICMDEDPTDMKSTLSAYPDWDWTLLTAGNVMTVGELFRIRAIPAYFLIGPDGILIQSPAYSPRPNGTGKTIDEVLHNIYRKLHPIKGHNVGGRGN